MIQNETEETIGSFWSFKKVLGHEILIIGSFGAQKLT
jgi:hypothetical protein